MSSIFTIPNDFISRSFDDGNTGLADYRDNFMRDRDRVLYCTAFRRLSGKTQIYTIGNDDHKRNRMTHSLEVAQRARNEFVSVKRNYDKLDGVQAYHGYMSFKQDEVTPELAHQMGIAFASRVWGERFQVVVTTHLNSHCLHNHVCQGLNEYNLHYWKHLQKCSLIIVDYADIWMICFNFVTI